MFVVVGVWTMDPARSDAQHEALTSHIVPGVRTAPGLVKGYWAGGPGDAKRYTFIVFEDPASAESFAGDVRANVEAQTGAA